MNLHFRSIAFLAAGIVCLFTGRNLAQAPAPVFALQHVAVIDGTGSPPRSDQTIVIQNGHIKSAGSSSRVELPPGAHVLDLAGRTVLPGLVMMHEHLNFSADGESELQRMQPFSAPRLLLAFGVTTVRTAGINEPYAELTLKRRIDAGLVPGPEMFVSGPWFNEPEGGPGFARTWRDAFLGMKFVQNADDARRAVRYWAGEGITSVKVYRRVTPTIMAAIIAEAHEHRLPVMGHIRNTTCTEAAALGIDFIEHSFGFCAEVRSPNGETILAPDAPQSTQLIRALVAARVTMDETPSTIDVALSPPELDVLHPAARDFYFRRVASSRRVDSPDDPLPGSPDAVARGRLDVAFVRAGGHLVAGSDSGGPYKIPGFSNVRAVERLHERLGFSRLEAIQIATINGATALGIQERTGSIAEAKEADLIIVRGDPSTRIRDIENVEMVFSNGVQFDPKALLTEVKDKFGWQ